MDRGRTGASRRRGPRRRPGGRRRGVSWVGAVALTEAIRRPRPQSGPETPLEVFVSGEPALAKMGRSTPKALVASLATDSAKGTGSEPPAPIDTSSVPRKAGLKGVTAPGK